MKTNEDALLLMASLLDSTDKEGWEAWNRAKAQGLKLPQPRPNYTVVSFEGTRSLLVRQTETGAVFRITVEIVQPGTT